MSGHSKWNNIKRKKEKTDGAKAKIFTKVGREISVAVREGGSDPNNNGKLRDLIAKAKSLNVPNDNIQRIIKKAEGLDKTEFEAITYEGYGPGGIAIMIEVATDNKNRIVAEVRHLFTKHGGSLGENGSVGWMFDRKGVITIDRAAYDEDKMMELALEAGADDVIDDEDVWTIQTNMEDFTSVRDALEASGVAMQSAELAMVPQNLVAVDKTVAEKVLRLMEALDDNDDVQNVYSNADFPEDMGE